MWPKRWKAYEGHSQGARRDGDHFYHALISSSILPADNSLARLQVNFNLKDPRPSLPSALEPTYLSSRQPYGLVQLYMSRQCLDYLEIIEDLSEADHVEDMAAAKAFPILSS